MSGKAVEKLLGHCTHFCMLRRELLSMFRTLYDFMQHSYHKRSRLWESCAKEARWASHLLKLCVANLRRPWSQTITASDASLSGLSVSRRELGVEQQKQLGQMKESWRYKPNTVVKPRERAQPVIDPFRDPSSVKPLTVEKRDPFAIDPFFPEVDPSILHPDDWHEVFSIRMQRPEHITLLEGRGIVAAVRHKLRSKEEFGKRHVHLNDNLGAVLLCSKGRSNVFGILRVSRRLAALILASGIAWCVRWIPSEVNVADKGSRRWEHLRKPDASCPEKTWKKQAVDAMCYPNSASARSKREAAVSCLYSNHCQEGQEGSTSENPEDQAGESSIQADSCSAEMRSPAVSGTDFSGKACSVGPSGFRLCPSDGGTSPICKGSRLHLEKEEHLRRGLLQVCEQHVRTRLRPPRRHKDFGRHYRCQPRLWPSTHASKDKASTPRLVKDRASEDKATSALAPHSCNDACYAQEGQSTCSGRRAPDVLSLSTTRRNAGSTDWRFSGADARENMLLTSSPPRRKKGAIQGRTERRKYVAGLAKPTMAGPGFGTTSEKLSLPDQPDLPTAQSTLEGGIKGSGAGGESCSSLSAPSQWSKSRPVSSSSDCLGSQAAGTLGQRCIRQALRSPRKNKPGVPLSPPEDSETMSSGRKGARHEGATDFLE